MLRLAPLQTDRNTGGRPLRFVEFGYAERNSKEHSLMRMTLSLPGQRVRKEQNHLDVWSITRPNACISARPAVCRSNR